MQAHYKVPRVYIQGHWRATGWLAKQRDDMIRSAVWETVLAAERSDITGV